MDTLNHTCMRVGQGQIISGFHPPQTVTALILTTCHLSLDLENGINGCTMNTIKRPGGSFA